MQLFKTPDFLYVSELTYVHWAAIILLAKDPRAADFPNIEAGVYWRDILKTQHHQSRVFKKGTILHPAPNSGDDFIQRGRDKFFLAYPGYDPTTPLDYGPIDSPLDEPLLELLRQHNFTQSLLQIS